LHLRWLPLVALFVLATITPAHAQEPQYTFQGWSVAMPGEDLVENQLPANLAPSGGALNVCGADRVIFWISYTGHLEDSVSFTVFGLPDGSSIVNPTLPFPPGDGVVGEYLAKRDAVFDSSDAGTFTGGLSVNVNGVPVDAFGTVTLNCG